MFEASQLVAVLLVAIAMSSAIGHAMEFPGKLRPSEDEYLAVQPIHYSGYTILGGAGEVVGMIAALGWAAIAYGVPQFPLVPAAVLVMAAMQATCRIFTHPVNRFWLASTKLGGAGNAFILAGQEIPARPTAGSIRTWRGRRSRSWHCCAWSSCSLPADSSPPGRVRGFAVSCRGLRLLENRPLPQQMAYAANRWHS